MQGASVWRHDGPVDAVLESLASRFGDQGAREFEGCPLYRQLCLTVAADPRLLRIAAERRVGQQPTNLLFAAVQYLLFEDPADELARWYVSIDGVKARPPETVGAPFIAFCLRRRDALHELVRTKLVQTNVVKRAAALRLGLAHIARRTDGPVTLIEIGASAGVLLAFDRYRYQLAGRTYGNRDSPIEVSVDWRGGPDTLPDLDRLPTITDRVGIDLAPIDPRDPVERRWLRALVWPGNEAEWALLEGTLNLLAGDPPRIIAADAIDFLRRPQSPELGPDSPLVVFHAATRAHLPIERREALDQAIHDLARRRRVFWLSLEGTREPLAELTATAAPVHLLQLTDVDRDLEETRRIAVFQQHADWAMPSPAT